jgi:hypothetical protein
MYNSNHLPAYKVVFYANDPQTGYYTKTAQQPEKTPVMRLPYQLKVEPTILHQIKCNALQIIRGKETFKKSGSFKFFTGLQDTNFFQWFSGNDYEFIHAEKKLSVVVFGFSTDNSKLIVFYFSWFYIDNPEARERFINDVIPVLLKKYPL